MRIALLLLAGLLQTGTPARVGAVEGKVELTQPRGTTLARAGDSVLAGDRLHSWAGSSLTLSTDSGVTFQLGADTLLEMKQVNGEVIAVFTDGILKVKSNGKPVRIETSHGQLVATEDSQEFEVSNKNSVLQVAVIRGSIRTEGATDAVFKSGSDPGQRVYEVGTTSPSVPRIPSSPTVIVYPSIGDRERPSKTPTPK